MPQAARRGQPKLVCHRQLPPSHRSRPGTTISSTTSRDRDVLIGTVTSHYTQTGGADESDAIAYPSDGGGRRNPEGRNTTNTRIP